MSLSASLLKFSRLLYFNCIQHSWDLSIISVSDNSSNYNNQKVCAVSEDANQCWLPNTNPNPWLLKP